MPIPGGVYALQQSLSFYPSAQKDSRRRSNSLASSDPEAVAFNRHQRYLHNNLKCTLAFYKDVLSSRLDKFLGVLVLETKEEVRHSGIFILMKGLSLPPKRRQVVNPVTSLKFIILGNSASDTRIDGGTRESYPVELDMPRKLEKLPPPMLTSEGKLLYRLQVFLSTSEGRHVQVGETTLQYQGYHRLPENMENDEDNVEIRPIKIEQQLQSKRSYLGLMGRRKLVNWEFAVDTSGFLPQEHVPFRLLARCQDKVQLECRVELVQKVWYQVPAQVGRRLSVKMKVNMIETVFMDKLEITGGNEDKEEAVWEGRLTIPKGQPPSYKFDFMNSVNYTVRVVVGVVGDKDSLITGESPIFIGTTREATTLDEDEEDTFGASGGSRVVLVGDDSPRSGAVTPTMQMSQSMTFIPCRSRASSMSSMQIFRNDMEGASRSSTPSSFLRMPPSYSQLSSRRPTLETRKL